MNSDWSSSGLYGIQILVSALVEQKEFVEEGLGVSHKLYSDTSKSQKSKIPCAQPWGRCLEQPQRRRLGKETYKEVTTNQLERETTLQLLVEVGTDVP